MPKTNKMGIMDAVTALTTLGDEESGSESGEKPSPEKKDDTNEAEKKDDGPEEAEEGKMEEEEVKPRYIPEHKKPDAALTFPEKVRDALCCCWIVNVVLSYNLYQSSHAVIQCSVIVCILASEDTQPHIHHPHLHPNSS